MASRLYRWRRYGSNDQTHDEYGKSGVNEMAKFSTRGSKVYIESGDVARVPDVITAATATKPVTVTPTTIGSFSDGDIVIMSGTGMPSIDDRAFVVTNITASEFDLCGSNGSNDVAATGGTATPRVVDTDMVLACANTFAVTPDTPPVIDATTFCSVEQFIGEATPGNMTLGGFVDACDPGYLELEEAGEEGQERVVGIEFPKAKGWILCVVYVSPPAKTFDINAAATFSGGGALRTRSTICGVCP
jgi:hypothetical protein